MKTYNKERLVAALPLLTLCYFNPTLLEAMAAICTWIAFNKEQVGSRMSEKNAQASTPYVECYKKYSLYGNIEDLFMVAMMVYSGAYSGLVGIAMNVIYAIWRHFYQASKHPSDQKTTRP